MSFRPVTEGDQIEHDTVQMAMAGIYKHWLATGRGDLIDLSRKLNAAAALSVKALK